MPFESSHPETLALHGDGIHGDPATGAVAPPLYFTTSYQFANTEQAGRIFALEEIAYTYTRTTNPTREILERRLAALEGGAAALAVSDGTAATLYSALNLADSGDNVVVWADAVPDHAQGPFAALQRLGVSVRWVEATPDAFVGATDDRTRAWYGASMSVPGLRVFPIPLVAKAGRTLGVPLIVDNSALPLTSRPLALGAAIVTYSAAGYLGGHGIAQGGAIIDGHDFPWETHSQRFPSLTQPDPCYHGTVWVDLVKKWNAPAFVARVRGRYLRDFGGTISPAEVFSLIQGVETLPLRIRQQTANADLIRDALRHHPAVTEIVDNPGALIGIRGETLGDLCTHLSLILPTADWGNTRSTAWRPQPYADRALISVGLEHPDDIIADLRNALDALHRHQSIAPASSLGPHDARI